VNTNDQRHSHRRQQGPRHTPGLRQYAAVILDVISPNEVRVRKAEVIVADDLCFSEEQMPVPLSKKDARRLTTALDNPPRPNVAARRAAKRLKKQHG
jgi:hypothetical protein